jgi:hypothetical protein
LAVLVITGVIALFGSLILSGALLMGIWALFGVCVLFTLAAYSYWSAKEPNRLQTEKYQLAQQRLLIGDERDPNSIKMIESQPPTQRYDNERSHCQNLLHQFYG